MPSPRVVLALAVLVTQSACLKYASTASDQTDVPVRDAAGRELGTLTLASTPGGLLLTGRLTGLPPGAHGIHVHAVGRCEPPFESAGPHWNPASRQHGTANPNGPHLGDMPNITVAADGSATVRVATPGGTLSGSDAVMDADGSAVVIHAQADDYQTDPSGNSGARIACGVVRSR
jgi:superoxide dismutase, Cu-Zn family